MPGLHPHEVCLILSCLIVVVFLCVYYYVEFYLEKPKVEKFAKLAIGSYHTSWCRDLD